MSSAAVSGGQLVGVIWVGMALTLVGSALIARRLPPRRTLALGLLWAGIFGVAFLIARALA